MNYNTVLIVTEFVIMIIMGTYFFTQLKTQRVNKRSFDKDYTKEQDLLNSMRKINLTVPLSEKSRPNTIEGIIGQEDGLKSLRAALCGPNPQHVIIYGPPGIGKTAAARIIMEEAKKIECSPFNSNSKFVEMDATTLRFDERGIADPLIGSVHDPIYQGAGAYGKEGIPQPKFGAVTKAHGGILFLDEIGELHLAQLNKLLKVLEDRKVFLESSYYSSKNSKIPSYIHDIFENGLPADFRLVGATTRRPEEIPLAIRTRCTEVFFNSLKPSHIVKIVENGALKSELTLENGVSNLISKYSDNGREAVNILQTAQCNAILENRKDISTQDVNWAIQSGRYMQVVNQAVKSGNRIGCVNGLAVVGAGKGRLIDIETICRVSEDKGNNNLKVTGIIEYEEIKNGNSTLNRKSTCKASIENVVTVIIQKLNVDFRNLDIHINIPGGIPIDGPSAGIAIFASLYSAITKKTIANDIAFTGEISILGRVLPVGGVQSKIEAAIEAGIKKVFIPIDNWSESYKSLPIEIIKIECIDELLEKVFY